MEAFNTAITAAMSRIGRTVTCETLYKGGRITLVALNGEADTQVRYERIGDAILLLDSRFTQRVRHNNTFDVHRAVGLLLEAEARTTEVRRKQAERKKKEEERASWAGWARTLNKRNTDNGIEDVRVSLTYSNDEQYEIEILISNKATVMAMIDYLQDGGFLKKKETKSIEE